MLVVEQSDCYMAVFLNDCYPKRSWLWLLNNLAGGLAESQVRTMELSQGVWEMLWEVQHKLHMSWEYRVRCKASATPA